MEKSTTEVGSQKNKNKIRNPNDKKQRMKKEMKKKKDPKLLREIGIKQNNNK